MATTRVQIGPADHGRRMTPDEFLDAEELGGYRYELARGILEVTRVPGEAHGKIIDTLNFALFDYRKAHPGLVWRMGGGSEFRIWVPSMESGRNPDIAVVFSATPLDEHGQRPPGLAIEVVSPRGEDRDYVEKAEEYLAYGLKEYWIVDPLKTQVTVKIREADAHGRDRWRDHVVRGTDLIPSEILPGLEATVESLWDSVGPGGD